MRMTAMRTRSHSSRNSVYGEYFGFWIKMMIVVIVLSTVMKTIRGKDTCYQKHHQHTVRFSNVTDQVVLGEGGNTFDVWLSVGENVRSPPTIVDNWPAKHSS